MDITLFHAPSTAALVVHWLLIELGWPRNMPRPVDQWSPLHAHAQRMKALPSFKETYAREGLTDWS